MQRLYGTTCTAHEEVIGGAGVWKMDNAPEKKL